jgi:solute carrier family 25 citrate transporter 1
MSGDIALLLEANLQLFIGGMTAGMLSTIGNQPLDVLKTRMQGIRSEYSSAWECIYKTFRREGIAGFYTGIVPRLARVIPGQGIIFMSFEFIVSILMALQQS